MQFMRRDCPVEVNMNINLHMQPVVALIAGILVLIAPRLLTWIIGIYLIVIGVMGLLGK